MPPSDTDLSAPMQKAQALWQDPSIAERYANAEKATRPFAKLVLEKANLSSFEEHINVFDLACGTGAAIKELYDAVPEEKWNGVKVLGGDVSESMVEYLKVRGEKEGWTGLETQVVDGNDIDLPDSSLTHALCTFAIFVIPSALPRLFTLLQPGGFVGISTWSYLPWHPLLHTSISKMHDTPYNPTSSEMEDKMFSGKPWGQEGYVAQQLQEAGFEKVKTEVKRYKAQIGFAKTFMESMQFPLQIVKAYWPEDKQEAYLKELNNIMYAEVVKMAGGETQSVEMEFEGIVGWGWKGEAS